MAVVARMEVPIQGMDCAECTMHVHKAIAALPGVRSVDVFLTSEKAIVQLDPQLVELDDIRKAVERAGYTVPDEQGAREQQLQSFSRPILRLLGLVFGVVLLVVVVGEWLGLLDVAAEWIPWPVWLAVVLVGGYPVFRNVLRAALHRQVIAHTLMTVGVVAALVAGEWATAAVVVFFMRVGDYVEHFTTERARRTLKDLTAMAPQTARLEQAGVEQTVPVDQVRVGDVVIVRPGERIPVDGGVIAGFATVDQATITGEAMPVEAGPGSQVFAATLVRLGSLRIRAAQVGADRGPRDVDCGHRVERIRIVRGHDVLLRGRGGSQCLRGPLYRRPDLADAAGSPACNARAVALPGARPGGARCNPPRVPLAVETIAWRPASNRPFLPPADLIPTLA